jgi:hypothetical protein
LNQIDSRKVGGATKRIAAPVVFHTPSLFEAITWKR